MIAASTLTSSVAAQSLASYTVSGDGIEQSLTGTPGDATRGRALVADRSSTCILCHSAPLPEVRFQGDLAPSLAGAGSRATIPQPSFIKALHCHRTRPI